LSEDNEQFAVALVLVALVLVVVVVTQTPVVKVIAMVAVPTELVAHTLRPIEVVGELSLKKFPRWSEGCKSFVI
jgi:hypothetical protein